MLGEVCIYCWSAVFFFNFDENDTKNWLATTAYLCRPCYFSFCSLHQYIWYSASNIVQDFPSGGGVTIPKEERQPIIWPISPETCMQMK